MIQQKMCYSKYKRCVIVNKKGCTQTAYVDSLVTMLVLHAQSDVKNRFY